MAPVGFEDVSLPTGQRQEALEGTVGSLRLVCEAFPEFSLLGIHARIVSGSEESRPLESTHRDTTDPPRTPHLIRRQATHAYIPKNGGGFE